MILHIGKRVKVPFQVDTQAIIVGINSTGAFAQFGLKSETHYSLRYLSDSGTVIDQTFTEADLRRDNPPPVDVEALQRELERVRADNMTLRASSVIARVKSKSKKRK